MHDRGRGVYIGATLLLTLMMPGVAAAESVVPYQDPQGRFTFAVPAGWVAPPQRSSNAALFLDAPQTPAHVLSVGEVSSRGGTLNAVILDVVPAIIANSPGYQPYPAGLRALTVGGEAAKQFAFQSTAVPGDTPYAQVLTVVLHDGTAYTVSFLAFPPDPNIASSPILHVVLDSWQFTVAPGDSGA